MNPDSSECAAGKSDFASGRGLAAGVWRWEAGARHALRLVLVLLAIWGVASALGWSLAAGRENAAMPTEGTQAGGIVIQRPSIDAMPIQLDVDRVIVPVTVVDDEGQVLTGLGKNDFTVFDEGVKQTILSFSTTDAPVAVGIVFDTSQSMSDKIQKSKEAVLDFFKTSNPQDRFMLLAFSNRPYLISSFTGNYEGLLDQVLFAKADGRTSLLDAVYLGLSRLKQDSADRKALIVISDGGDNHSRYDIWNVRKIIREANVQVYTIGIFEPLEYRVRTPEEADGPSLLARLATISGGRAFSVENPDELPDVARAISDTIRNQYLIGYQPSNLVRDGQWRRIKVKVHPIPGKPFLRLHARAGYYAPIQ